MPSVHRLKLFLMEAAWCIDANGNIVKEMKYFEEDFHVVNWIDLQKSGNFRNSASLHNRQFDKEMQWCRNKSILNKIIEYLIA